VLQLAIVDIIQKVVVVAVKAVTAIVINKIYTQPVFSVRSIIYPTREYPSVPNWHFCIDIIIRCTDIRKRIKLSLMRFVPQHPTIMYLFFRPKKCKPLFSRYKEHPLFTTKAFILIIPPLTQ